MIIPEKNIPVALIEKAEKSKELFISINEKDNFIRMYENYYDRVYNYVFFRLFNKEASEDVTSEIFLKIFDKRAEYDPKKAQIATWIFTISKNCVTDYFKKNKYVSEMDFSVLEDIVDYGADAEETVFAIIEREYVVKALSEIKEKDRSIIYLKYFEGLTYKEIGLHLNITEKNVSVTLMRAMKKFENLLNKYMKS